MEIYLKLMVDDPEKKTVYAKKVKKCKEKIRINDKN